MTRTIFALLLLIGLCGTAAAQGCGQGNPNCVAPTPPLGDNSNRIATTAFVAANTVGVVNPPGAVNFLQGAGSTTGNPVTLSAIGSDANIGMTLAAKGIGTFTLNTAGAGAFQAMTTVQSLNTGGESIVVGSNTGTPSTAGTIGSVYASLGNLASGFVGMQAIGGSTPAGRISSGLGLTGGFTIVSQAGSIFIASNGVANNDLAITQPASSVNGVQIVGATTGNPPTINVAGSDTNASLLLSGKGSFPVVVGNNAHFFGSGTAPTASACAGFALSAGSTDLAGRVTFTSATSCALSFGQVFANAPFCVVSPGSAVSTSESTTTTSVLTATFGTAQTAMMYHCMGS
jgi:hypothetical protein